MSGVCGLIVAFLYSGNCDTYIVLKQHDIVVKNFCMNNLNFNHNVLNVSILPISLCTEFGGGGGGGGVRR